KLSQVVPEEYISGPAFSVFHFITSVEEGFDVELGFPVTQRVETDEIKSRILPAIEVLALVHKSPIEKMRESSGKLYASAYKYGLISDEFSREIYLDSNNPEGNEIEIQFVLHNWDALLTKNLDRVLGKEERKKVMQEKISLESTLDVRFQWSKGCIEQLERRGNIDQNYDIISSCAHVFPKDQIAKLRIVYEKTRNETKDPFKGVDAVIEFMDKDPGWPGPPIREGNIIYSAKSPCNQQAYDKAKNKAERKKAYCFCPIVRNHLDRGMPSTFCYCGAGWYRQQWEGALGKPVKIEIVKSLLKDDELCQFAIHLPDDL
ncbi:MAG: GyrI-like domain-containing protein, partial [Candidatus Hodarchaeota archaeon]